MMDHCSTVQGAPDKIRKEDNNNNNNNNNNKKKKTPLAMVGEKQAR